MNMQQVAALHQQITLRKGDDKLTFISIARMLFDCMPFGQILGKGKILCLSIYSEIAAYPKLLTIPF